MTNYTCDTCGIVADIPLPPEWNTINTQFMMPSQPPAAPTRMSLDYHVCDKHNWEDIPAAIMAGLKTLK